MSKPVCLYQINTAGGFEPQHNHLCGYRGCDENAEEHIAVPGSNDSLMWCGNVCSGCSKKIQAGHKSAVISGVKYAELAAA
jgi:hypothetical protein